MRVMVTGGHGFIGGYVTEELVARGHDPFVFDRRTKDGAVDVFVGDIRDAEAVTEAMAHSEGWIHLAGVLGTQETITNPLPAAGTNLLGGLNVLEAAAQYSVPGVNIAVGNWWMNNTYSITKNAVERFVHMYRDERGLAVSTVRAYNAYGPRQSIAAPYGDSKVRKIMPAFICRALTGTPIEIYGDGSQIMDMIHVRDAAAVLVDALEHTAEHGPRVNPVEAGTGRRTTVADIADAVISAVAARGHTRHSITHLPMRPGEPPHSVVCAENPPIRDWITLEDGVAETVEWFETEWLPTWRG